MDNKPVNTADMEVVAMECKSCGASFCATKGYVSKCPYCGKLINARDRKCCKTDILTELVNAMERYMG